MFIVALIIIAENWKQPKCPSKGEQKNKQINKPTMAHLHNGILFNYLKKQPSYQAMKDMEELSSLFIVFYFLEVGAGAEEAGEKIPSRLHAQCRA